MYFDSYADLDFDYWLSIFTWMSLTPLNKSYSEESSRLRHNYGGCPFSSLCMETGILHVDGILFIGNTVDHIWILYSKGTILHWPLDVPLCSSEHWTS